MAYTDCMIAFSLANYLPSPLYRGSLTHAHTENIIDKGLPKPKIILARNKLLFLALHKPKIIFPTWSLQKSVNTTKETNLLPN